MMCDGPAVHGGRPVATSWVLMRAVIVVVCSAVAVMGQRPLTNPNPNQTLPATVAVNGASASASYALPSSSELTTNIPDTGPPAYPYQIPRNRKKDHLSKLRKSLNKQNIAFLRPEISVGNDTYAKDPMSQLKERYNVKYGKRPHSDSTGLEDVNGVQCTFETTCAWTWEEGLVDGFHVVTGANLTDTNHTGAVAGPTTDLKQSPTGHFLHLRLSTTTGQRILRSPTFSSTRENCYLEVFLHEGAMHHGSIRIAIEPLRSHEAPWVPAEIAGNNNRRWEMFQFRLGRISKEFVILFEVVPNGLGANSRGHVSIDNLMMKNCFPDPANETCNLNQIKCHSNKMAVCTSTHSICDIRVDCDENEDELLNCDKIPFGGRCDFENGQCGWRNSGKAIMDWSRHNGPTPTEKTGPDSDHTYQNTNQTGHYMFVNMNQHADDPEKRKLVGFASNAVMNSVIFNPPPSVHMNVTSPYSNSCVARFYVHQYGMNAGSINFSVVEMREKENVTSTLWWSTKNLGNDWIRIEIIMPNITSKYYLQFEARMGMRIYSDVAIDDFSLSPECFGLNIPPEHLDGYNYWNPRIGLPKEPHKDFINKTTTVITTCGVRGVHGPTASDCFEAYNNTEAFYSVKVVEKLPFKGMQVWKVPREGYYTIIAKGAGGGLGSGGVGSSRGAVAISVLELHKDEEIYMLVGQSGEHACIKSMGYRDEACEPRSVNLQAPVDVYKSQVHAVKNIVIDDGAGGGGGGTFVFLLNAAQATVPLLVAGGGGGLGIGRYLDDDVQHGKLQNFTRLEVRGEVHGDSNKAPGPGGGWKSRPDMALDSHSGASVLEGGRGGEPCYEARGIHGQGGFGGGGGGCNAGGGGGGYAGGDTLINSTNGEGGTSYIAEKRTVEELSTIYAGANSGVGSVIVVPAIQGCGCDYLCVALDEYRSSVACICPDGWFLKKDNLTTCQILKDSPIPMKYLIVFFAIVVFSLISALGALFFMLYNRYQRKKQAALRHKMLLEQDLQLSRLRNTADDSALTNFNPNYGCDGILNGNVDVKSLPQVARESLRLVKALGQGAFGEVYQGLYRHRDGDAVEMPVAVKTLPEMSTGQAEADFLMEAAIMAKFKHPNIVHLIGVCFDRHPRFIVLELLAGGDLKNFLREGRNKPERPSPLTMKDLVFCALDVAKGCRYMESKRFIHRDIAARNCLLSSKGPGRVVKIADFGMARDIYRSDYYRKGGKAMLPIKWMPPEAFLDGIFTSKTDIWSFGVLLWEVFSLGLMPYTGLPNREVMQLVTGGGRLDAPPGSPPAIYSIMSACWSPTPENRPSFSNLLERLTACTQDPEVMNAPLPSFFRPPSTERDQTIMRPSGNDDFCLQVPNSDYLVPLPGPRSAAERLLSEATGVTLSESMTTCTPPVVTSPPAPIHAPTENGGCWETSFMMSNSKSDQPLLSPDGVNGNLHENGIDDTKLISLDTPQQTPITLMPPVMFGGPITNSHMDHCDHSGDDRSPPEPASIPQPITLDPSALCKQGMSYANVRMMNAKSANHMASGSPPDDVVVNGNGNGNGLTNGLKEKPYTIQGYNDRYIANENHSEISC